MRGIKKTTIARIGSSVILLAFAAGMTSFASTSSSGVIDVVNGSDTSQKVHIDAKDITDNTTATSKIQSQLSGVGDNTLSYDTASKTFTIGGSTVGSPVDTTAAAAAGDILSGKQAWVNGGLLTGLMTNNGALSASIYPNASFAIPLGYTTGGTVSVNTDIPSATANEQAVNASGDKLYYADATAQSSHDLTKVTTTNTGLPVYYVEANVKNLTAGSAAWVNGTLIKGTGADNDAFYKKGYSIGYTEGELKTSKYNIVYTYHSHIVPSGGKIQNDVCDIKGGCYTIPVYHKHDSSCHPVIPDHSENCPYCGARLGVWNGDHTSYSPYQEAYNHLSGCPYVFTCGKSTSTIIGYSIGCSKTESSIEKAVITFDN